MFQVITVAAGLASADVGLGYNYKPPHSASQISESSSFISPSYGLPSYAPGGSAGYYNGYYGHSGYQGYHNTYDKHLSASGQQAGYQGGAHLHGGSYQPVPVLGNNYQNEIASASGINNVIPTHIGNPNIGLQSFNQYHHSSQYHNSHQKYQEGYQVQQQPAQIFKHFYVHAAPDDDEPPKPRNPIVLPQPQKHYKIIFIKTPAQRISAPQIIPVPQQNEEKTIVYVLVKKPEEDQDIVLPKVEQPPPAKPEVFFIKYNNKEGSQAVINNIVKDYNKGQSGGFSSSSSSSSSGPGFYPALSTIAPSAVGEAPISSNQQSSGFGSTSFGSSEGSPETSDLASSSFGTVNFETSDVSTSGIPPGSSGFISQPSVLNTGGVSDAAASASVGSGTSSSATAGSGYENSASATASTDAGVTPLSTSQGVPHETYGIPKFRV